MKERLERLLAGKRAPWILLAALIGLLLLSSLSIDQGSGDMTKEEQRISRTLSMIQGAGECRITLYYPGENSVFGESSAPQGAVILAAGAGDVGVRLRLSQAAEALLGLSPQRIEIFPMEAQP